MGGSSGGGLSAQQQAQLTAMLKATRAPATSIPAGLLSLGAAPSRVPSLGLADDARTSIIRRQGFKATVKTGPLGDAGFGSSISKPVIGAA